MTQLTSMKKLAETANVSVESFQSLTNLVLDASEQLIALNGEAARAACNYAWANTTVPFGISPSDERPLAPHEEGIEQVTDYLRKMSALCVKTQADLTELNTRHASAMKDTVVTMIESAASAGPAGMSDVVSAWKSGLGNATAAYENLVRMGCESAQANVALPTPASAKASAKSSERRTA